MKTKEVRKRLKKLNKRWRIDFVDAMKADGISGYFAYGGTKKTAMKNMAYEEAESILYAKVDDEIWIYYNVDFDMIPMICMDLSESFGDEFIVIVPDAPCVAISLIPKV